MCHGIPPGQMLLRDEIAQALLDADDGYPDRDDGTRPGTDTAPDADDADDATPSHLSEEAADADLLTGAMSTDDLFAGDGSTPR